MGGPTKKVKQKKKCAYRVKVYSLLFTYHSTYEGYDKDVPQFRKMTWRKVFETEEAKSLFELPYEYKIFTNDFWMPKENVWRRILSKSYISCLEKEEQEQLKLKVEALLKNVPVDDRNRVFYPHETHLVYFKKRTN